MAVLNRCLTFADCRLQITDYRLQTANSGPQTVDYKRRPLTVGHNYCNPTQILVVLNDHVKEVACVDSVRGGGGGYFLIRG